MIAQQFFRCDLKTLIISYLTYAFNLSGGNMESFRSSQVSYLTDHTVQSLPLKYPLYLAGYICAVKITGNVPGGLM